MVEGKIIYLAERAAQHAAPIPRVPKCPSLSVGENIREAADMLVTIALKVKSGIEPSSKLTTAGILVRMAERFNDLGWDVEHHDKKLKRKLRKAKKKHRR